MDTSLFKKSSTPYDSNKRHTLINSEHRSSRKYLIDNGDANDSFEAIQLITEINETKKNPAASSRRSKFGDEQGNKSKISNCQCMI